jgi:acetylornithine deacetylase
MSRTARLLADLIALPSVNPGFLPPGDPRGGEIRVGQFLASLAKRAGLDVEWQKVFPERSNLLVRLRPPGKPRRTILLAPHLDTVNVADEKQFSPTQRNGRLYGRGACDTKGCVAAFLTALTELAKSNNRPRETEIVFAGLIDEENGQAGSRALAASGFKADLAIVGEPTRLQLVTAHKGSLWLQVETHGLAAHGATPQHGKNAVHAMARVIDFLETDYVARLRRKKHPLLGHATSSVGTIRGGTQANIVPDHCVITIDRRTLPGETEKSACREIAALPRARKLPATVSSVKQSPCPPMETDPKLPLVRQFLKHLGQASAVGVNYFCDAAVLAQKGIPGVVFGPGDIAQAHTADEWISLAELERGKDLLSSFLKTLS